jgi:hypothetical protein
MGSRLRGADSCTSETPKGWLGIVNSALTPTRNRCSSRGSLHCDSSNGGVDRKAEAEDAETADGIGGPPLNNLLRRQPVPLALADSKWAVQCSQLEPRLDVAAAKSKSIRYTG